MAGVVGFLGLQAGSAWTWAQDYPTTEYPAAEYSVSGNTSGGNSGGSLQPLAGTAGPARDARPLTRGPVPFRLPAASETPEFESPYFAPAGKREPVAPTAFDTFIGDNGQDDSVIPTVVGAQPADPAPVPGAPPRRNPLFRDPADNNPENLPGRPTPLGPDGLPVPGSGPDDLFTMEDDEPFVLDPADDQPLGIVGRRMYRPPMMQGMEDFYPIDDRWRLGFPQWNRYLRSRVASPWTQSVIKGDYPLWGTRDKFTQLTAFSDTFFEKRTVPFAGGKIDQHNFQETVFVTTDFFRGDGQFHPSEWLLSLTPAFRFTDNNFAGTFHDFALQQGFLDVQLAVVSDYYDTTNVRLGRQAFASDFRNFLFADTNDSARLFGTDEALRTFWNVIGFSMCQKDGGTALNTFDSREQQVLIGNIIRQDFIFSGFNALAGVNWNHDTFKNKVDAVYLEVAGNGRIGEYGISAAFIQALGHDNLNPVTKVPVSVNAQMAALELTRPTDWFVPRLSMLYASGDKNPGDGVGRGFDMIFDNPNFAGGGFSYLNREAIQIGGTRLSNGFSFLPNLRNKNVEPSNFVNPGLLLGNAGIDAVLSTRWQMQLNANYYEFVHPESVAVKAGRPVGKDLGKEVSLGLLYRPLIVENVIFTFGTSAFDPGSGITALSGNQDVLYTFFTALTGVY